MEHFKKTNQPFFLRSILLLTIIGMAFGFSDAFYSFLVPIVIQRFLNNVLMVGIFLCLASVFALCADFILGFISSRISYITLLLIGIILTALMPSFLAANSTWFTLIMLMVTWGIYHEFIKISFFNYSARYHQAKDQSKTFGILFQFYEIPYVLGPLFAAVVIGRFEGLGYVLSLLPLAFALLLLRILSYSHKIYEKPFLSYNNKKNFDLNREVKDLKKSYRKSFIPLIGVLIINMWQAYVWTVIPLEASKISPLKAAILIAAFTLPLTLMQSYSGKVADSYGRNITSVIGLSIGGIATLIYGLQSSFLLQIVLALISTAGFSIANPAVLGQISFRALKTSAEVGESAGLQRIMVNLGYIIGPLLAGSIAASTNNLTSSFTFFGLVLVIATFIINMLLTHIHITGLFKKRLVIEYDM